MIKSSIRLLSSSTPFQQSLALSQLFSHSFAIARAVNKLSFKPTQEGTFQILTSFDYNIDEKGKLITEAESSKDDTEIPDLSKNYLSFDKALFYLKLYVKQSRGQHANHSKLNPILDSISQNIEKLTLDNSSLIVWALARLDLKAQPILSKIDDFMKDSLTDINCRDFAIILWGFTRLGVGSEEFWNGATKSAAYLAQKMSMIDLANTIWSFSKQDINDDILWNNLETSIMSFMRNINHPQTLSSLMISFAKMNRGDDEFWRKLENQFFLTMHQMEGQALANSIWALSKRNRLVFVKGTALETVILSKLNKMKDLEVASIAWNFAKLSKGSNNFWQIVYKRLTRILRNDPKEVTLSTLCTCAWTLVNLKITEAEEWNIIEKHLLLKKADIKTYHLHSLLTSYSEKNRGSERLWEMFQEKTMELIEEIPLSNLSGVISPFAIAEKGNELLWQKFQDTLISKIKTLSNQGLIVGLWAFTKAQKVGFHIIDKILQEIDSRYDQLNATDIGMVLWCLGRWKEISPSVDNIIEKTKEKLFSDKFEFSVIDIAHISLALSELKKGTPDIWKRIEQSLESKIEAIEEEGWVIFLKIDSLNNVFPETFWISAESAILKNYKKYSIMSIINFMKSFHYKNTGSDKLWFTFQQYLKSKLSEIQMPQIADVSSIISKRKIGENDFWNELEKVILEKSDKIRKRDLCIIVSAFGHSHQGTLALWKLFSEKAKLVLQTEPLNLYELKDISFGFSLKRKGDNEFWNLLERRITEVFKRDVEQNMRNITAIIRNFSNVRKGSREFWKMMIKEVMTAGEKAPFRQYLSLIRSLEIVKELEESEKNTLVQNCIDKVLNAEEAFAGYFVQISFERMICSRISDSDFGKIEQKIVHFKNNTVNTAQVEDVNRALNRLIKNRSNSQQI